MLIKIIFCQLGDLSSGKAHQLEPSRQPFFLVRQVKEVKQFPRKD